MDPKIVDLYDEFKRGGLDRREFLRKLASLAGGTAAASALLPLLEARPEASQSVPKDDPGLRTQYINYAGATGDIRAYSARPKDAQKRPGVVVIHENRGLNAHIEDVARRVAKEGYLALAPDALSPFGGTPANPDEARPSSRSSTPTPTSRISWPRSAISRPIPNRRGRSPAWASAGGEE